ncbi:hypothetical protein C491_11965 [Natronococcus amylolyticus DSM 10524]|uniref:Uncharacterized protein n=1 Tax=Natronococcus amylolyticus DSM 10524 TaxID=1227497 RepID=L9X7V9_9EURY|nr:hypothetical protein [Natronococcus amylolyticus]ELY56718.1 hypothetical protein C491_11965 [Natronococcus amylolyticus DSM 10524]
MSPVTTGGTAASIASNIVAFDATYGVTVVATAMLALFMVMMVFLAVAPIVSSKWSEQLGTDVAVETADVLPEDETADASSEDEAAAASPEAETAVSSSEAAAAGGAGAAVGDADDVEEGTFTSEDLGKLVERADGKVIGTVASVGGEQARVEPSPDALDQILIRLDRMEVGEAFVLEAEDVREISSTRVLLEREFVRPTGEPTPETETEADDVSAATE